MTHWTERHKTLLAVFVLLRRADGKILAIRRANTGYMDGKLGLPAGHAEGNEPAELALVREAAEEVSVTLDPKDLRLVLTSHRLAEEGGYEYIDLYFETTKWQGEPRNAEPNKCSEVLWIDPANLPEDVIPVVRTALTHIAAGESYFSIGF